LGGRVGRAIIRDQDLILAGAGLEGLPDLPQQQAHGLGFVVARDAEVEHGPQGSVRAERYTPATAAATVALSNARTRSSPRPASHVRRAGSPSRDSSAAASAGASPGGTRTP